MTPGANAGAGQPQMNSAGFKANVTNILCMLPPDIQTMTRQQLDHEAKGVYTSYPNTPDYFMKLAVHFQRKGYGDRSPAAAASFIYRFELSDKAAYAKEIEYLKELATDGFRVTTPKVYHSLQDYEKANPPIPNLINIVSRCGVLMHQAETRGSDAPYELWRAVLSILKFTEATEAYIEDMTGGHADFDMGITVQKMHDITAPFLCSTFATYEPDTCKTCKFYGCINSPISLGYANEPKVTGRVKQ